MWTAPAPSLRHDRRRSRSPRFIASSIRSTTSRTSASVVVAANTPPFRGSAAIFDPRPGLSQARAAGHAGWLSYVLMPDGNLLHAGRLYVAKPPCAQLQARDHQRLELLDRPSAHSAQYPPLKDVTRGLSRARVHRPDELKLRRRQRPRTVGKACQQGRAACSENAGAYRAGILRRPTCGLSDAPQPRAGC